jgi:hypothetical protein
MDVEMRRILGLQHGDSCRHARFVGIADADDTMVSCRCVCGHSWTEFHGAEAGWRFEIEHSQYNMRRGRGPRVTVRREAVRA